MAKSFKVSIVTAEQVLLETEAVAVSLPGIDGSLGIWANHAPLVTALVPGVMVVRHDDTGTRGTVSVFSITRGFLEVARNEVSVMVDACEPAPDIDVTRAEESLERAKERLEHRSDPELDVERAEFALARARARMKAAERGRNL